MQDIEVILFDLGGVLVELDGQPIHNSWWDTRESPDENWRRWLTSPLSQEFEKGVIGPEEFAGQAVIEFNLTISAELLLQRFEEWVLGFYPGVLEILQKLSQRYTIGVYSNITEVHWPVLSKQLEDSNAVSHFFASYLMGMAKPDPQSYIWVADQMGVSPGKILFLDDNQINVEGARSIGIQAQMVKGPQNMQSFLTASGILNT